MRSSSLLLLLLLGSCLSLKGNDEKGHRLRLRMPRVVGGERIEVNSQPHIVNIRRRGQLHCGGSLVTPRCVLTAAHCLPEEEHQKPTDYVVRGGVTYLRDIRNGRHVQRVLLPRGYNRTTLDNDVALLQLLNPLQGPQIGTIRVARQPPRAGSYVRISGWGLTDERSIQLPNQLHSVQVMVLPQQQCQQLYAGYRNLTDSMYCASVAGHKDACHADSGGPAVNADGQLVGIVSWGRANRCARADSPGVYTSVAHLHDWIAFNMDRYCY
ncbi:trypsin alpha-3 [Drosophila grimshawi]|uniref:trypsin n=1 Tax=Drosophila grimshawi TaxID=7222 RepID=B4IX54_DROGR|nr:trypsin alpha-3 [Drosophila grimshawi]EDV96360.1 GH15244 [Drosophila grimshawi]